MFRPRFILLFILLIPFLPAIAGGASVDPNSLVAQVVPEETYYGQEQQLSLVELLSNRAEVQPFHVITLLIFICAIVHTFMANKITRYAHRLRDRHKVKMKKERESKERFVQREDLEQDVSFNAEIMHFFGEIEVVFAIWLAPLFLLMAFYFDWRTAIAYADSRNYTEPLFVVVIMALASTRPIIQVAETCMSAVANLGKGTITAWWLSILIVGPLLGSLITEPAAMTISAILLAKHFYRHNPPTVMKYATLGLLFVNVSVGGVLTHFAAPPVLMVAAPWEWDTPFMLVHFGWKAVLGILTSTALYYAVFRKEFAKLSRDRDKEDEKTSGRKPAPMWIIAVHLGFLAWVVFHNHHPVIFIGALMVFLAFYQASAPHQSEFNLRPALLVGLFLAGLVIHGGLQGWWISPLLSHISEGVLMKLAIVLTAFNDNAAVTYLTTLVSGFSDSMKYAVVSGAVTGGGLTVIANAPNPAGQSLLSQYFKDGVNPLKLFLGAIVPTLIVMAYFTVFGWNG